MKKDGIRIREHVSMNRGQEQVYRIKDRDAFLEVYGDARNFMTPRVIYREQVTQTRFVELSTGTGIHDDPIFGVTVVDDDNGVFKRRDDLSDLFRSQMQAETYIASMCNNFADFGLICECYGPHHLLRMTHGERRTIQKELRPFGGDYFFLDANCNRGNGNEVLLWKTDRYKIVHVPRPSVSP